MHFDRIQFRTEAIIRHKNLQSPEVFSYQEIIKLIYVKSIKHMFGKKDKQAYLG